MLQKPFGQSARTLPAKASIGRIMGLKRILLVGAGLGWLVIPVENVLIFLR
jgi:hypothetical protein